MNESAGKARFSKFKAGSDTVDSAISEIKNPVITSANEFADKKNIGISKDEPQKVFVKEAKSKRTVAQKEAPSVEEKETKRQKRTSIIIDLEVYQALSQLKQSGMTIGDIINDALHDYLDKKYPRYVELAKKIIDLQG